MKSIIKNEEQFARWFRKNYKKLGYSKIVRGDISRFPDFVMIRNGREVCVELETAASNFIVHKHNINKVDGIVCLVKERGLGKPVRIVKDVEYQGNIKVTLSFNSKVDEKFKKFCKNNAIILSKKPEIEMQQIMEEKD
ncbi:MAG: hypothetical protein KKD18_05925, partial [Nanoarchaeota archaeon]|nr:hypothetical protein [Nanoarchaeota archaeon]